MTEDLNEGIGGEKTAPTTNKGRHMVGFVQDLSCPLSDDRPNRTPLSQSVCLPVGRIRGNSHCKHEQTRFPLPAWLTQMGSMPES